MAASHRDDSPDSLFLPSHRDPHYDNEHSSRRRRFEEQPERWGENGRPVHYLGDGLDFRRPVMSTSARERSVSQRPEEGSMDERHTAAAAPPVIDLTDELEDGSEDVMNRHGEVEMTGTGEVNMPAGSSHAAGRQRLPRFGRDVIAVENDDDDAIAHLRPRAFDADNNDDDVFADLPGANFLALPPRRSASGRVQYSTLRRPARPSSPPQEMDDGEIEYVGTRQFEPQTRRTAGRLDGLDDLPAPHARYARPRSVTPYPAEPPAPVAIDLTDDADEAVEIEDDDEVQFVDERRIGGVNMAQPDLNAGHRTEAGEAGGFGIGRLANILRDGGAAIGGRLAQRVQDYSNGTHRNLYAGVGNDELRARRMRLEQQLHEAGRRRDEERREFARLRAEGERGVRTPAPPRHRHRHNFAPRVRQNPDGTLQGYTRVGWHDAAGVPRAAPPLGLGNLNIGNLMDYGMAAFDMGYGGAADNRPATPKYSPPPEPAEGFTRNPGEEEIVVCPNCGDELAVAEEETKQEIWVIKGCGHAYCGDCAHNRAKTKSKKGKDRAVDGGQSLPPPFKNCVVDGCPASASAKSMVRVYFGS